jgi:alpha-L-fucosidase
MPDGNIQPEFVDTLTKVGSWLEKYGESVYGTRGSVVPKQDWGVVTAKSGKFYAHILRKPTTKFIFIPSIKNKITVIQHLNSKSNLQFKQVDEGVFVYINNSLSDEYDDVIVLNY